MSKKLFTTLFIVFFGTSLFAQKSDEVQDSVTLEELVITGTKTPVPIRETAKQVQIISKDEIARSSGKDLSQVLQEQSGIIVNSAFSNPGKDKGLYVRGAGSDYTLILIDGQPAYDPSGSGGAIDLRMIPLEQVEKIEILKGSQSTLYGTDAIAGVINIITDHESDKPVSAFGGASYGSLNTIKTQAGVNGKVDLFDYYVNFYRNSSDGISEAKDETGNADFDKDGYLQKGLQVKLGIRPNENIKISPYFRWTDFDGDYDADAFADADNKFSSVFRQIGANATYKSDRLNVNLDYGHSEADRKFVSSFGTSPFRGRFENLDAFARYDLQEHIMLLGGLNIQRQKVLDTATQIKDPSINLVSPYLTLLFNHPGGLNLEIGYRYNNHSKYGSNSTYSVTPSYYVTEDIRAFASYTTGFKTPTLYQLYGTFGANEDLKPQKSNSFEVGLEYSHPDDFVSGSVNYFKRKIKDIIVYEFTPGYLNRDEQNDGGLEVLVRLNFSKKVTLEGFYNYVDGELTTLDDSGEETEISNLIRRPKHRFSLLAKLQPVENLFVSIQGQYIGDRNDHFYNPANFYAREEVDLNPYFLLNAYAEYGFLAGKLTVFADLKNITNTDFTEVYGYNTIGFNVNAGFRFRW